MLSCNALRACKGVLAVFLAAAVVPLHASDPFCPVYPSSQLQTDLSRIQLERAAAALSLRKAKDASPQTPAASANFIDDYIFGKMAADGVPPAPPTNDAEFLRRISIDLIGRIPSPEQVAAFLDSNNPDKRSQLIDSLIGTEPFVDYWTAFYANLFQVTSGYYNYIGIPGRNVFYNYLRDFVANNRPYDRLAMELIPATGDSHKVGPPNFIVRSWQNSDPLQDTWDNVANSVTTKFLGVQTQCVSCHDGRNHLEKINLYLSARKRVEFWKLSAFLSRMSVVFQPLDAFYQQLHALTSDRPVGSYSALVPSINPGPKPARSGGPYAPAYMFTGETPQSGAWRQEFARIVTSDRQFARAAVNYLWAHFFSVGIVDPPDGWDLARIDPKNPPAAPWTLQPSHPELLEALADEFIHSGYDVRHMIRLIVQSNAYQHSSRYPGQWQTVYARYFAKHFPRRLSAEEVYDSVTTATLTQTPMVVEGFDQPLYYAMQLPDPTEPRTDGGIRYFLDNFGRGDWWNNPRSTTTSLIQVLFMMNDSSVSFRTFGNRSRVTRVGVAVQAGMTDEQAVTQLFLATLGRRPSSKELAVAFAAKTDDCVPCHSPGEGSAYEQWLSDIQWALLNRSEFVFNY